jgi:hypothetical protein
MRKKKSIKYKTFHQMEEPQINNFDDRFETIVNRSWIMADLGKNRMHPNYREYGILR